VIETSVADITFVYFITACVLAAYAVRVRLSSASVAMYATCRFCAARSDAANTVFLAPVAIIARRLFITIVFHAANAVFVAHYTDVASGNFFTFFSYNNIFSPNFFFNIFDVFATLAGVCKTVFTRTLAREFFTGFAAYALFAVSAFFAFGAYCPIMDTIAPFAEIRVTIAIFSGRVFPNIIKIPQQIDVS